jgi:hypothetical protein
MEWKAIIIKIVRTHEQNKQTNRGDQEKERRRRKGERKEGAGAPGAYAEPKTSQLPEDSSHLEESADLRKIIDNTGGKRKRWSGGNQSNRRERGSTDKVQSRPQNHRPIGEKLRFRLLFPSSLLPSSPSSRS